MDMLKQFPGSDIEPYRDMVRGMQMDIPDRVEYKSWDDLYLYCYRVASTVGLMTLPVMGTAPGVTLEEAREPAVALGIALQITNILRDVGEDARDRVRTRSRPPSPSSSPTLTPRPLSPPVSPRSGSGSHARVRAIGVLVTATKKTASLVLLRVRAFFGSPASPPPSESANPSMYGQQVCTETQMVSCVWRDRGREGGRLIEWKQGADIPACGAHFEFSLHESLDPLHASLEDQDPSADSHQYCGWRG
jgi:hypothetical protein